MIWLVGGTTEGRDSLAELLHHGYSVMLSVVSKTGIEVLDYLLNHPKLQLKMGPLSIEAMENLVEREQIKIIVDATHPFAKEVSANLRQVASKSKLPLVRVLRPELELTGDYLTANSMEELGHQILACTEVGQRVFLAMGANGLPQLVPVLKAAGRQVVARILPTSLSITKAEQAGLTTQELVAIQGHGSLELNLSLLRHYNCHALVTKDSGKEGGLGIKAQAADLLKIPLVILKRPKEADNNLYCSAKEIVPFIEKKGWSI